MIRCTPLDSDLTTDGKGAEGAVGNTLIALVAASLCLEGSFLTVIFLLHVNSYFNKHGKTSQKKKGQQFIYIFDIGFSLNLGLDIVNSELKPHRIEFQINKFGSRTRVKLLESMSQEAWAGAPEPPLSLRDHGQFTGAGEGMPFSSVR